MENRKPISKKTRFEIFKRDKFTCQYCGRIAPDVILEIDHIKPIAEGGDNNMLNLITSCMDCNRGKGKRKLSDDSSVKKQQEQLQELAEKQEQLEMMIEWRKSLLNFKDKEVDKIADYFTEITGFSVSESGKNKLRKMVKEFGINEIIESIDIATDKYYIENDHSSAVYAFDKISGIASNRNKQKTDPRIYYFNYLKKACFNKFEYCNENILRDDVFSYVRDDEDFERAKLLLYKCYSWTNYHNELKNGGGNVEGC